MHETEPQKLPEQPKIAEQITEKVNVEKVIRPTDSFKQLADKVKEKKEPPTFSPKGELDEQLIDLVR